MAALSMGKETPASRYLGVSDLSTLGSLRLLRHLTLSHLGEREIEAGIHRAGLSRGPTVKFRKSFPGVSTEFNAPILIGRCLGE
jgi:hypothetical protein